MFIYILIAIFAISAGTAFARLAAVQDLEPIRWGIFGSLVYLLPIGFFEVKGFDLELAPFVWISPLGCLAVLFVIQAVLASQNRYRRR